MTLVDTNDISEARRNSEQAVSWLAPVDTGSIYLSTLTIGEIARRIALKEKGEVRSDIGRASCGMVALSCGLTMPAGSFRSPIRFPSHGAGSLQSGHVAIKRV